MTQDLDHTPAEEWPLWRRIAFRFFFIYLLLQITPWNWFNRVPGVRYLTGWTSTVDRVAVEYANAHLFHVRDKLIMPNGSGDTSFAWAALCLYLTIATVGCAAWTVLDGKRTSYPCLDYWLRTIVRYYIAMAALSYGIIKVFSLQMPFPALSQLATPLGDLLPMRFSWLFIGYSTPYQMFGGFAEFGAGLLLLNRRTVTLGLLAAAGAFANVVMINLAYDVPVKLYAMHLFFSCVFLLLYDGRRLFGFLILNHSAPPNSSYEPPPVAAPWQRYARWGVKAVLLYFILLVPFQSGWTRADALAKTPPPRPFVAGVYDVQHYVVNGVAIPPLLSDSARWSDVIIDNQLSGSVNTRDSVFWQRYRRGYFRYKADTVAHTVAVWKTSAAADSTWLFSMRYEIPDSTTIRFWTKVRGDSLFVELVRTNRHFQLAERQFHWISEYNR